MSGQTSGFIDMNSALADSQMISLERDIQRRFSPETFDPMGLTNYEIERESALYGAPTMSNPSDPNQGEMGPPKPDYVLDRELFDEQRANMPGSTAGVHYTPEGDYTLGMKQRKKEKAAESMAAASCPSGMEYDPDSQRCVPEGTLKKAKQDKLASSQPRREQWVNVGLGIGNWLLEPFEKRREKKRMKQIDNIIQENRFTVAPTNKGMYMTNTAAPVPPTQQTPVQFTGYNPSAFAKYGKEKKNDYVYLTPQQIMHVISMGGQVEFLD